jgi:hypothetical protein
MTNTDKFSTITLGEVIKRLWSDLSLDSQTKADLISAVKKVAAWISPDGLSRPADPGFIAQHLRKMSPAMAGLSNASMANLRYRIRRALKLVGISVQPGKQTNHLFQRMDRSYGLFRVQPAFAGPFPICSLCICAELATRRNPGFSFRGFRKRSSCRCDPSGTKQCRVSPNPNVESLGHNKQPVAWQTRRPRAAPQSLCDQDAVVARNASAADT